MERKDREQSTGRGNADVVRDERGRGQDAGRAPFQPTRDQTEGERQKFKDQPGAQGTDEMERDEEHIDDMNRQSSDGDAGARDYRGEAAAGRGRGAEDRGEGDSDTDITWNSGSLGRGDRGDNPVQRPSVGQRDPSTTGGKVGRAAERRDRSGDPEKP